MFCHSVFLVVDLKTNEVRGLLDKSLVSDRNVLVYKEAHFRLRSNRLDKLVNVLVRVMCGQIRVSIINLWLLEGEDRVFVVSFVLKERSHDLVPREVNVVLEY